MDAPDDPRSPMESPAQPRPPIESPAQPRLLVYTAHGCCLCDEAREVLDRLAPELGLGVEWIHIDGNAELEAAWREQLPAGVLDGRKVFKYRVDEELLRRRAATLAREGSAVNHGS